MRSAIAILLALMLTVIAAPNVNANETIILQANHGLLLKLRNIERVVVAAPEIADVNLITRSELMIIAKRVGETTISVWDARGFTTYRVVVVAAPTADVEKALSQALGDPSIKIRIVGDTVILEGTVKTDADKARAESIASAFGKRVGCRLVPCRLLPPSLTLSRPLRHS